MDVSEGMTEVEAAVTHGEVEEVWTPVEVVPVAEETGEEVEEDSVVMTGVAMEEEQAVLVVTLVVASRIKHLR